MPRTTMPSREFLSGLPNLDLLITDPPWDLQGSGKFDEAASYARLPMQDILEDLEQARKALRPGRHAYIFLPAGPDFAPALTGLLETWTFLRLLVWDKGNSGGLGAYRNNHEPIAVLSNGKSRGFQGPRCTYPSILRFDAPGRRTAKPWELYRIFVEMSSQPDELVADPYCGTDPLSKAIARLQPARRWASNDVLSPETVGADAGKVDPKTGDLFAYGEEP